MFDYTTEFMKGALLGYCQSREPEEVAMLFDDIYLTLDTEKAANISAAISARYLYIMLNVKDEDEVAKYIKKMEDKI